MLIIDHNHLCFFAGVLQDEMYHQNDFFGSLTLQTGNHRGGDDFGSAAKIITPYIKCLLFNINTCAFLQVFYRMRYITRMSFMGLWRCKLKIIGGWWFRQCCQNHHPLHKMLNFDYNHLFFFAGVLQDEIYHQNDFFGSLTLQTGNHRGGDDFGSAAKIITPYIKCLLFNINTCAFLQVFYRMRYITRMSFMGLWSSKLKIIGGWWFRQCCQNHTPLHKMLII